MRDIRVSTDRDEVIDAIYGKVVTSSLREERIDLKRKWKAELVPRDLPKSIRSIFVVLPAISSCPTLSVKRCARL